MCETFRLVCFHLQLTEVIAKPHQSAYWLAVNCCDIVVLPSTTVNGERKGNIYTRIALSGTQEVKSDQIRVVFNLLFLDVQPISLLAFCRTMMLARLLSTRYTSPLPATL